jgi:membrane fusion protein (multidrug efflux system)
LDDGKEYAHTGKLLFTDLTVDENTGQVSVRAELPNPNGLLLPGMYVRVQLEQAQVDNAAVIPQQSVTRNEKGNFVMMVAEDGTVAPRPCRSVVTGQQLDRDIRPEGWRKSHGGRPDQGRHGCQESVPWQADAKAAPQRSAAAPAAKPEAAADAKPAAAQ